MSFLLAIKAAREIISRVPWQMWLVIALVVAFLGFGWYNRSVGYREGSSEAVTEIKDANEKALEKADRASDRVRKCYATGGTWDVAHGVCDHP